MLLYVMTMYNTIMVMYIDVTQRAASLELKRDLKPTTFRLTREARRLLQALAQRKGLSMAGVLEVVIRKEAKEEGIE